ncbi:MAG: hypothetical protein MR687_06965 [Spirochaetales bacterium]|nr:hypothetical protein [Spirochaetales bacterium]
MSKFRNMLFCAVALILVLFSVSCDNVSFSGSEVTIEEPSFIEGSSDGKSLVNATAKIDMYKLKMVPQWTPISYTIVGDTSKNTKADKDGYIVIEPPFNNLGYFSQGLWNFGLRAYTKDMNDEYVLVYEVEKTVEINGDINTISISSKEILPTDSSTPCTIKLHDFDFLATGPITEYGKTNGLGMILSYKITNLSDTTVEYKEVFVIDATKVQSANNGVTGVVDGLLINAIDDNNEVVGLYSGAYSLSIYLNEYVNGNWIHTGGTSISFVSVPGIEINITGDSNLIDLCRYDYVTPGAGSGIEIESGISSNVNVKAYKGVVSEGTLVSSTVSVTTKDTVILVPEVTNGPSSISTNKWFVDGVEQSETAIDSNGYLTYKPTTAKTYTITYMFLDGTNYNTISGNYYLAVTAAT